jgi:RHS repeat-associated protein
LPFFFSTNPYRQGDTVFWNKTRFDELGRAVESYAPATLTDVNNNNLQSLGVASFELSTVTGYLGTVAISSDTSGRKGRSITNALGQLVRVDEPVAFGGTVTNDLGAIGSPVQPTYYYYSPQGKMVRVQQGAQNRYFLYDSLGRLLRVKQPEQEANTGLAFTDPLSGNSNWSAGFTYDLMGNVLTATDAKGTVVQNDYDKAGRVKTRSYTNEPSGITTPPVDYFYDGKGLSGTANFAKGKLTKVSSSVSETRYTNFDNFGRVLSSEQITGGQAYPTSYKYNMSGALTEETYPSGEVVRSFLESDGDLSRIAVSGHTHASDFSYTATGKIASLRLGNGRWETGKLNEREQVTEIMLGTAINDGSLWKVKYEYGELNTDGSVNTSKNTGNIAKQTTSFSGLSSNLVQTYKYDALNRLTEAKEPTGPSTNNWVQTFGFDRFGNRTSFNQTGFAGITQTPSIDANTNRFAASQGYSYDKNGNIVSDPADGGRSFVFNGDNKQTQVYKNGVTPPVGTYSYDGAGKRVKKVSNTETTIFVYDAAGKLIAEYSSQISQDPTISYTATDRLGSPRAITDKQGNIVSRRDFMPFGEDLNSGVGNRSTNLKYSAAGADQLRKRFTGYEKDIETGLDFAEARYYNNANGRFTAVDPLLASGISANPQTFNRYIYTLNNPLIYTDPTGLQVGDWYGGNKSDLHYKYILRGDDTEGRQKVTTRNRAGELIGPSTDVAGGFVVKFNPYGPWYYNGPLGSPLSPVLGAIADLQNHFYREGWEGTPSDATYDAAIEKCFSPSQCGNAEVGLELFLSLEGGGGILRAGVNVAGKVLMERVALGGTRGLADNAIVIRNGIQSAEKFANGSGVVIEADGTLTGVSVKSANGKSIVELAEGGNPNAITKNGQIGVTTAGEIRSAGGTITQTATPKNPFHCDVCGLSDTQLEILFKQRQNPLKIP